MVFWTCISRAGREHSRFDGKRFEEQQQLHLSRGSSSSMLSCPAWTVHLLVMDVVNVAVQRLPVQQAMCQVEPGVVEVVEQDDHYQYVQPLCSRRAIRAA